VSIRLHCVATVCIGRGLTGLKICHMESIWTED
jgi:hypothetical protein